MRQYLTIFIIVSFCNLFAVTGEAAEFVPWNFNRPALGEALDSPRELSLAAYLMYQGSLFFSRYISPVDGDRCAMYPTCSAYSRQAIAKHGFFIGSIMTADRLIHENNEIDMAQVVEVGKSYRYSDSVAENDFWWYKHR